MGPSLSKTKDRFLEHVTIGGAEKHFCACSLYVHPHHGMRLQIESVSLSHRTANSLHPTPQKSQTFAHCRPNCVFCLLLEEFAEMYKPLVGKETGHRLRTDCAEFHRTLSRGILEKSIFMIYGFLEKSLHHRIPPKWFLETPAASELILGGPLDAPQHIF